MKNILMIIFILNAVLFSFGADKMNIMKGVKRIVFVGDSLTDGAAWPDWVVSTLRTMPQYRKLLMFNAGVGGDTISGIKARLQRDVIDLKPDMVIMHAGTNDCALKMDMAAYQQNYDDVVMSLTEKKIKVLLLTLPSVTSPEFDKQLSKMDVVIREIAKKYECPVAEVHAAFTGAIADGKACIGPDGCHHLIDGWRTMATTVLRVMGCEKPFVEKSVMYPGTVTNWWIGPAILRDGDKNPEPDLSVDCDPEKAGWRRYNASEEQKKAEWWQAPSFDRGGIFIFGNPKREKNSGAFAFANLHSNKNKTTTMRIGGFKPYTVWLNGEKILYGKTTLGIHPDIDRMQVKLKKGNNRIIVYNAEMFYLSFDE